MSNRNAIIAALPPVRGRRIMLERNQDVQDIIRCITFYHKKYAAQYDQIAHEFNVGDERQIAKKLWKFCKDNIDYVIQDEEVQSVRSPARILQEAAGDCKHYASFIAGVLDALKRSGLDLYWAYRFADYVNKWTGEVNHHVFVVLEDRSGREIWIDPVLNWFDYHLPYDKAITRTIDTLPAGAKTAGVGCMCHTSYAQIGAAGDTYLPVPAGYPSNIPRPALTADGKLVLRDNFRVLTNQEIAWIQKALQPLIVQYSKTPYNIYWSVHGWGSGKADIITVTSPNLAWIGRSNFDFLQYPKMPGGFDQLLISLNDILPALASAGANSVIPGSGGAAANLVNQGSSGNTAVDLSAAQLQALQQQQTSSNSLLSSMTGSNLLPILLVGAGLYFIMKN